MENFLSIISATPGIIFTDTLASLHLSIIPLNDSSLIEAMAIIISSIFFSCEIDTILFLLPKTLIPFIYVPSFWLSSSINPTTFFPSCGCFLYSDETKAPPSPAPITSTFFMSSLFFISVNFNALLKTLQ